MIHKEQTCFACHMQGSTFKQTQYKIEMHLRNSDLRKKHWIKLSNTVISSQPKVVKKLKTIWSNPIQIWLSRNYKILIQQNTRMRQNLNPSPFLSLIMFCACERQGSIFPAARLG